MHRLSSILRSMFIATPLFLMIMPCIAGEQDKVDALPHLDSSGQLNYQTFLTADKHRAFAIAPGGTWGWKGGEHTAEAATEEALRACQSETEQKCVLYATNDRIVFDEKTWATLWGPYLNQASVKRAPVGTARGARFYNLAFRDPEGKPERLSSFRGKVVVLHFWGSWCPSCQRELPELQKLQQSLRKSPDIKMILLQVREDISTSLNAIKRQHLGLELHDSESKSRSDDILRLADGTSLHDRDIAAVFPSTYILDKHGIVLFSHAGPVSGWLEYLPLLKDAAAKSGK